MFSSIKIMISQNLRNNYRPEIDALKEKIHTLSAKQEDPDNFKFWCMDNWLSKKH